MSSKFKMRNSKIVFFAQAFVLVACLALAANGQSDGSQQNQTGRAGYFAIVNARIVPVSGPVIESGTLIIRNGKIESIGTSAAIPGAAERIDAKGLTVFPGMIDAATNMGLVEIPQGLPGSVDTAETGTMNANAKAIKGIHPHSAHINVTRVNGITTVMSYPTGGIIAGQGAIINLNGSTPTEMAMVSEYGLVINYPRITLFGGGGGGFGGQPIDFNEAIRRRDAQIEDLRKMFREAENYLKARDAAARDATLPFVPVDQAKDAMAPYIRGERPVLFRVERDRDIRSVAKFVTDLKLKGIIIGGQEAWLAADDIKRANIGVIYTNVFNLPTRQDDAYDILFEAPAKMQASGIRYCISTGDSGANSRDLPYQAGHSGAFGLSRDDALKAVTLYAAQVLGIDDKVGSLEVGKVANVVVADGDILDPRTNIKYVFINGRMIPLTSRHTELFDSFKDRK